MKTFCNCLTTTNTQRVPYGASEHCATCSCELRYPQQATAINMRAADGTPALSAWLCLQCGNDVEAALTPESEVQNVA